MYPKDEFEALGFLLGLEDGTQLAMDFGVTLIGAPNGLQPNQAVDVVGTWDAGD